MGIMRREFLKLVYGATSPYARQFEYEDVDRLTRDDLVAFHATYYGPTRPFSPSGETSMPPR